MLHSIRDKVRHGWNSPSDYDWNSAASCICAFDPIRVFLWENNIDFTVFHSINITEALSSPRSYRFMAYNILRDSNTVYQTGLENKSNKDNIQVLIIMAEICLYFSRKNRCFLS